MKPNFLKIALAALVAAFGPSIESRAQSTLTNGLQAYYLFDGDTLDSSGNGNDGANNGGAYFTTDRFGNANAAIYFPGAGEVTTDFMPPVGEAERTISGWFNVPAEINQMTMMTYGDASGASRIELKITSAGQFALDISSGTLWTIPEYNDSTWHQFIVVVNSGTVLGNVQFYMDGDLQTNVTSDAPNKTLNTISTYPLMFGQAIPSVGGRQLTGALDEVRVYNRALSAAEAAELYELEVAESNAPPTITEQPQNAAAAEFGQATFSVGAFSYYPISYQWQRDGTNLVDGGEISGSTTNELMLASVSLADVDTNYTVIVANSYGSVTSRLASLTIFTNPPAITNQPKSLTVTNQGRASFTVAASSPYFLSYQWQKNGTNMTDGGEVFGSTSTNLILQPASSNDVANYAVIVSNLFGTVTSSVVTLSVVSPSALTNGLLAYYTFNGSAFDASGNGNNGTNFGGTFVQDRFGLANEAIYLNGSSYVDTGFVPPLAKNARTFSGWFNVAPSSGTQSLMAYGLPTTTEQVFLKVNPSGTFSLDISGYNLATAGSYNDANWHQFVVIIPANAALSNVVVYLDDVVQTNLTYNNPFAAINTVASHALRMGEYWVLGQSQPLVGGLDDVRVYNRALADVEVLLLYALESTTPDAAPLLVTPPANLTVTNGASASFTAAVSGLAPFAFRWQQNGTNLSNGAEFSGVTTSNLVVNPASYKDAGMFSVVATNAYGSVTSSPAALTVRTIFAWRAIPSPQILGLPVSVTVQAENITNGIATNFQGTVALSASGGLHISPTTSGPFTNGVWTGKISVPVTTNNLVLTVSDALGDVASANSISVVSPPQLGLDLSDNIALLYWPVLGPTAMVQVCSNLPFAQWTPVSGEPLQLNGEYVFPVDTTGGQRFFRIQFTSP